MSMIHLINASCANQQVDVVVNAANDGLWEGGGICGVIFRKAGSSELAAACRKYKTPLRDGDAVITPAFNMKNAKAIIHAVGPDFRVKKYAFRELYYAYYNSLCTLKDNGYHSIAFPLISAGIFGGKLKDPVVESTKQCLRAYACFTKDYPEYEIDVKLCAYTDKEMQNAQAVFNRLDLNDIGSDDFEKQCLYFISGQTYEEYQEYILRYLIESSWHYTPERAAERMKEHADWISECYAHKVPVLDCAVEVGYSCG